MRRLTVSLTVVAMIASLLPFAALIGAAHAAGPAPTIAPPDGKTAVRASDAVTVTGDAAGAADGPVKATLIGLRPDGSEMFREAEVPGVQVSGGQFQGELVLGCGFRPPGSTRCNPPNPDSGVVAAVAVELPGVARSNTLRVDYTKPEILRYELVGPQTLRVVFSEPVRAPDGDNPADWDVDHDGSDMTLPVRPVTVTDPVDASCAYPEPAMSTGCTRLLELPAAARQTEDATPFVRYLPDLLSGQSAPYQDYAGNDLRYVPEVEASAALDRIRPAAPHIQTIAGKSTTGGAVISRDAAPTARVTNLMETHRARLLLKRDGGGTRAVETTVAPETNAVDLTLPAMTADGGYTVTAVAIDAAGNRSDDDSKTGPYERSNGAMPSVTYTLDRIAPEVLAAALINTRTVGVNFTEPVLPDGDAGRWFVGNVPVTATGSGDSRTLTSDVSLLNPGALRWEPKAEEPGSTGRYGDVAGNGMAALSGLVLSDLPALTAPVVAAPTRTIFTSTDNVSLHGTADKGDDLVAELFVRGSEETLATAPVSDGRWSINRPLTKDDPLGRPQDGRYTFVVRIRNTKTGMFSQRTQIPDIVRDTAVPQVDVTEPADGLLGSAAEYGVGDNVTVTWTASDPADDAKLPDHLSVARVILASSTGTRRDVSGRLEARPGQEQSFDYRLTTSDLETEPAVDLTFEVVADDFAHNRTKDVSGTIKLLASRIGYTPVLVAQTAGSSSVIEARFPTTLQGEPTPTDWWVDGNPVPARKSADSRAIILEAPLEGDPNARPLVQFQPTLAPEMRLRATNGRQISEGSRRTLDRISPALAVQQPDTPAVIDRERVVFSGTTDETAHRNTIVAYRTRANGERFGPAIAKRAAAGDGDWSLSVPLVPNRVNRIVVQAVDPSGNRSELLPSSPYTVTEDSIAPVVRITSPQRASRVQRVVPVRWRTVEAHPRNVRIQYRVRGGTWRTVANSTADDGYFRWTLPKHLHADVFDLRVTAFDRTSKRRTAFVSGLLGDFARPVVRLARAVGPYRVALVFNEPVYMPRFGFSADGIGVSRVIHDGARNILVLNRSLSRTTPVVRYSGTATRDRAGNRLAAFERTAQRGFVLPVTRLAARRVSPTAVRLTWRDARNRPAHLRSYRIFRNGERVGTVVRSARAVTLADTRGTAYSRYVVRAVDNEGRMSQMRGVRIR